MTASVVSGLFLYFEGLRTLEIAVEEICRSDMNGLVNAGNQVFESVREQARVRSDFLQRYNGFGSYAAFQGWAQESLLTEAVYYSHLNGGGFHGFYWDAATSTSRLAFSEDIWGSLRADGRKEYYNAKRPLGAESYETPDCSPCAVTYSVDPATGVLDFSYNYTQTSKLPEVLVNNIGKVVFESPRMWYASDKNPYFYVAGRVALPPINNGLFNGLVVRAEASIVGEVWNKQLRDYDAHAIVIVAALKDGAESIVYGGNVASAEMDLKCNKTHRNSHNDCFRRLKDLGGTIQESVGEVNKTAVGDFIKKDVSGGNHWIRRLVYFQPSPLDNCPVISLVWIKSVSSMSDELNKGLNLFITFAVIVSVFDIIIGIVEIICVSMPLQKLSEQMVLATRMEFVDESIGVKLLSEIYQLDECFHGLVSKLLEYKSYLPQSMFAIAETDVEDISAESEKPRSHHSNSNLSSGGASVVSSAFLQKVKNSVVTKVTATKHHGLSVACINLLNFRNCVKKWKPDQLAYSYGEYIQVVYAAAELKKGTVDRMAGDRLLCTWLRSPKFATVTFAHKVRSDLSRLHWVEGVAIGIACGAATSGNFGSSKLRSYMTLGSPVGEAERLACLVGDMPQCSKAVLLAAAGLAREAENSFEVLPAGRLGKNKFFVILEEFVNGTNEWMYNLEERENNGSKAFSKMMTEGLDGVFDLSSLADPYSEMTRWIVEKIRGGHNLCYNFSCTCQCESKVQ